MDFIEISMFENDVCIAGVYVGRGKLSLVLRIIRLMLEEGE